MAKQIYIVVTTSSEREDDAYNQSLRVFDNEQEARTFFKKECDDIYNSLVEFNKEEEYDDREIYCDINENEANIVNDGDNPEIWQVNFYSQTIN